MLIKPQAGLPSVLGSFTVRAAMLITLLATVKVPRKEDNTLEEGALRIYNAVWICHLIATVTLLLNHYHSKLLGIGRHSLNIIVVAFQIIVFIYICVYWVFPNEPDLDASKDAPAAEKLR